MRDSIYIFYIFRKILLSVVSLKRNIAAIISVPKILSGIFDFASQFFDKCTNYFDLLTTRISLSYKNFRIKHPSYAKFADRVNRICGIAYDFIVSPRAWRIILVTLSVVGFAVSSMGAVPLAIFALNIIGISATAHFESKQKVHIMKLKREEQALRSVVKQKQLSLRIAEKLGITNSALAEKLGFKTLSIRMQNFVPVPLDNAALQTTPASLLNLKDLKKAQREARVANDRTRQELLDAKITQAEQIAQQKNNLGYTTVSKAGLKAASSGFVGAVTSLGMLGFVSSPYTIALGVSSIFANYVGSGITRYTDSNLKQALKNAVSVYRLRPDVPPYETIEDIERKAREARLERKTLKHLENHVRYKSLIATIANNGLEASAEAIVEARRIKSEIEATILTKAEVTRTNREIKAFDHKIQSKINALQYEKARAIYSDKEHDRKRNYIKTNATKLIVKIRVTSALLDAKCDKHTLLEVLKHIDQMKEFDDLRTIYKDLVPDEYKAYVKAILKSPHTKQEIEAKTLQTIQAEAANTARAEILASEHQDGLSYGQHREKLISEAATRLNRNNIENLRNKYLNRDYISNRKMYWSALRSIFDFTAPYVFIRGNPHDLLLDTSTSDFATFKEEKESLSDNLKEYRERIKAVPNIIREAVNLDSAMKSIFPILTILARDPAHIRRANHQFNQLIKTLTSPQSSRLGSQVISDDRLPATVNNPSDNNGILNVTFYLLFARIGQLCGSVISYGVNSYRDWRQGKSHSLSYDKTPIVRSVDKREDARSTLERTDKTLIKKPIKPETKKGTARQHQIQ
jgi:hypothetical protein